MINRICPYCHGGFWFRESCTIYLHGFVDFEGFEPSLRVHVECVKPMLNTPTAKLRLKLDKLIEFLKSRLEAIEMSLRHVTNDSNRDKGCLGSKADSHRIQYLTEQVSLHQDTIKYLEGQKYG